MTYSWPVNPFPLQYKFQVGETIHIFLLFSLFAKTLNHSVHLTDTKGVGSAEFLGNDFQQQADVGLQEDQFFFIFPKGT